MNKYHDYAYVVFRVLIGVMFFLHGSQKFGLFGGNAAAVFSSLMSWAGAIELVVGIAVVLGCYILWAALLGAAQMLIAYVMVHAPRGLNPLVNQGELALL